MGSTLLTLLKANLRARLRRLLMAFSTPRRCLLSALVVGLAVVWTGQTVASVLLREPYAPEDFRRWVVVPLFAWFLWHLVRVAWKRPETAIEWSEEEEALIVGGPFAAHEQLLYRFVVILTATLPKAALTIFVLWPDLSWSSPSGLVLALVGLELFRMVMDIGTCCLSRTGYWAYRFGIVGVLAFMAIVCRPPTAPTTSEQIVQLGRIQSATHLIEEVLQNEFVAHAATSFLWSADVIAAQGTTGTLWAKIFAMLLSLATMAVFISMLHSVWQATVIRRDRRQWQTAISGDETSPLTPAARCALPVVPFCGPLIWRQGRRAFRYGGSLLISMAIPALLLSPALVSVQDPVLAFMTVVTGGLFYTFVLLPEAIKFDFRLDSDHLCQLKMLPMTPTQVVLGQMATPIFLASCFQIVVFVAAGMYRSVDGQLVLAALALAIPLTILFVAVDNLTFLLYPQRPTQEGFEAFLRTILKFTGKTVLLALFAGAIIVWAPLAALIANATPQLVSLRLVFVTGIILGIAGSAAVLTGCVVSAFRRFDVSLHGMS
jgi:hypothetical protein